MTDAERKAWAEAALHQNSKAGSSAALARQDRYNAERVAGKPDEHRVYIGSAELLEARAKVAAEMAAFAKQKIEGFDV